MNRMSPLVARRFGRAAPVAAVHMTRRASLSEGQASTILDDLKLFATGWAGGLVFFGTFFG